MRIEILTTFLDGRDRFEVGDIRNVQDAEHFIANGWAKYVGGDETPAITGDISLNVHNSIIGLGDSNG